MSAKLTPSYYGYVGSTKDALLIIQEILHKQLELVPRRPHERERPTLIQSGNVFVFIEEHSGIKRWTDGISWSPSRILGRFLVYRELDKQSLSEKDDRKKKRRKMIASSYEVPQPPPAQMAAMAPPMANPQTSPSETEYKNNTISPGLWAAVKDSSLGGKIPIEDEAYYFLDNNYQLQNMSTLHQKQPPPPPHPMAQMQWSGHPPQPPMPGMPGPSQSWGPPAPFPPRMLYDYQQPRHNSVPSSYDEQAHHTEAPAQNNLQFNNPFPMYYPPPQGSAPGPGPSPSCAQPSHPQVPFQSDFNYSFPGYEQAAVAPPGSVVAPSTAPGGVAPAQDFLSLPNHAPASASANNTVYSGSPSATTASTSATTANSSTHAPSTAPLAAVPPVSTPSANNKKYTPNNGWFTTAPESDSSTAPAATGPGGVPPIYSPALQPGQGAPNGQAAPSSTFPYTATATSGAAPIDDGFYKSNNAFI
ncbi:hypothetical protein DICA0_D19482 [Diutina catenulata]